MQSADGAWNENITMKIELIDFDWRIPYARNLRHSEQAIANIVAHFKAYGFWWLIGLYHVYSVYY